MRFFFPYFVRFSLLLAATQAFSGCWQTSPLVGTWSGTPQISQSSSPMAGAMLGRGMKGPCKLTLKADGTGFLKMPIAPEYAIAWTQEENKVILRARDGANAAAPVTGSAGAPNASTVGTLSTDKQKLNLDLGLLKIDFSKQADAN